MLENMLAKEDVAKILNVSPTTIYRLVEKGELKAHKVGSSTQIKPSDVEAYLAANEVKVPERPEPYVKGRFQYKPGMKVVSL